MKFLKKKVVVNKVKVTEIDERALADFYECLEGQWPWCHYGSSGSDYAYLIGVSDTMPCGTELRNIAQRLQKAYLLMDILETSKLVTITEVDS